MEEFTLKNGLRIALCEMPYLRSVTIGVYVKAGSMLETPDENGLSHFMEHMAFKGTEHRTARQIAEEMDAVGGQLNAATGKLSTHYYAKVIDEDLPLAADILSDMILNPLLAPDEFEKERGVILEEISMVEDTPDDLIFDLLSKAMFGDQSLGMSILGPAEKIRSYSAKQLCAYRNRLYSPKNAIVSLAGHINRQQAEEILEKYFGNWTGDNIGVFEKQTPNNPPKTVSLDKETEQLHICLGYTGYPSGAAETPAVSVLNTIFGSGMSSRLFQKIREELGMAYSIFSGPSGYPYCGDFSVYVATNPKNAQQVMKAIKSEIDLLLEKGITEKEFNQAKAQIKSGIVLGIESPHSLMSAMAGDILIKERPFDVDKLIHDVEIVTMDDVMNTARTILSAPCSVAFIGKNANKYERMADIFGQA